jgi:hypothetical protein
MNILVVFRHNMSAEQVVDYCAQMAWTVKEFGAAQEPGWKRFWRWVVRVFTGNGGFTP